MISRNLWQLLLSGLCCLALVVFTACDAQGPNKKSDNGNASSKAENSNKSDDASSTTDADADDADMDDSSAKDANDDHDHDGHDHDHDGHDHDHDGHDHNHDDGGMADEPKSLSASSDDFTMNLDGMPSDRLVDPAVVLDTAALGIPIRASGVKSTTPKQAYEDLIYGNIRIRMDTSIALRRAMLEEGVAPTDPGVRNLEGQILKAKDLLEQAGESVAPIEPPIQ